MFAAFGVWKHKKEENEEERALLHSELWGSLFRGGYMVGKLERSLSGFHVSSLLTIPMRESCNDNTSRRKWLDV